MLALLLALPSPAHALDLSQAVAAVQPGVAALSVTRADGSTAAGSGFVAGDGRLLVTAYHVVEGASTLTLTFGDGAAGRAAGALAVDPEGDLAVLALTEARPALALAEAIPPLGGPVMAAGNPQGLGLSYSDGILSAARTLDGYTTLQHSAPVSPGSSGGPLTDQDGRVIGVNSFIWSQALSQNLNFAVHAEHLRPLLERAAATLDAGAIVAFPQAPASPAYMALAEQALPRAEAPPVPSPPPDPGAPPSADAALAAFVEAHPGLRDPSLLDFLEHLEGWLASAPLEEALSGAWQDTRGARPGFYGHQGLLAGMSAAAIEAVAGEALVMLPEDDCYDSGPDTACYVHAAPTRREQAGDFTVVYHLVGGRLVSVVVAVRGQTYRDLVGAWSAQLGLPEEERFSEPGEPEVWVARWRALNVALLWDGEEALIHHGPVYAADQGRSR